MCHAAMMGSVPLQSVRAIAGAACRWRGHFARRPISLPGRLNSVPPCHTHNRNAWNVPRWIGITNASGHLRRDLGIRAGDGMAIQVRALLLASAMTLASAGGAMASPGCTALNGQAG